MKAVMQAVAFGGTARPPNRELTRQLSETHTHSRTDIHPEDIA